jgi:polyisoprenoid-binding protein YceI
VSTTTPASIPTTGTWKIDPIHSTVSFKVKHNVVATFRGYFHDVTGQLVDGVLSGEVAVENLDVGSLPLFKEHLLAPDWFDAANFPTLSFTSTDLHAHGDHLHAAGELTIKGITKAVEIGGNVTGPLSVKGADGVTADRLGIDLITTIDRNDFKVGAYVGDEVTIEVSLELAAQA